VDVWVNGWMERYGIYFEDRDSECLNLDTKDTFKIRHKIFGKNNAELLEQLILIPLKWTLSISTSPHLLFYLFTYK